MESTTRPMNMKYPYVMRRSYLCGDPDEIVRVDKNAFGRTQHAILSTFLPDFEHPLFRYTLQKCAQCATIHLGWNFSKITNDQDRPKRGPNNRRDGFIEALDRYKYGRSTGGGSTRNSKMIQEEERMYARYSSEETPDGLQQYQRVIRCREKEAEVAPCHASTMTGARSRTTSLWGSDGMITSNTERGSLRTLESNGSGNIQIHGHRRQSRDTARSAEETACRVMRRKSGGTTQSADAQLKRTSGRRTSEGAQQQSSVTLELSSSAARQTPRPITKDNLMKPLPKLPHFGN